MPPDRLRHSTSRQPAAADRGGQAGWSGHAWIDSARYSYATGLDETSGAPAGASPPPGSCGRPTRNGRQVGVENSQTTSGPPGRVTRRSSASAAAGVLDVAQPEGDGHRVEAAVGERQLQARRPPRSCSAGFGAGGRPAASEREVGGHHGRPGVGERLARGAGAGGEVEDPLAGPGVDRLDARALRQARSWPRDSTSLARS